MTQARMTLSIHSDLPSPDHSTVHTSCHPYSGVLEDFNRGPASSLNGI